jgi:type II secretion system (T2SS) protein E
MKKRRLGEILRERGHLSTADLNQLLLEQRGKRVHLGELLLQRGKVAKIDLISALAEVSDIPYLDCTRVQVDPQALKLIPHAMARRCNALPIGIQESGLIIVMAEPQNLHLLDELRFKSGKKIIPRLGFRSEIALAIDRYYGIEAPEPAAPLASLASSLEDQGMEFISFSDQQRNIDAMREMEAELLQKSKATPAVQIVAS